MDLTFAAIVIMSVWVIVIVAAGLFLALRPGGAGVRLEPVATPPSTTGPRDEIPLGGTAEVLGNVRGRVRAVEIDPQTRRLVAIRLATGLEDEAVRASAILAADGQVVSLSDVWPEITPDTTESSATLLREGTAVTSAEGKRLGRLRVVCADPTTRIVTALVVDGWRSSGQRLVPFDRVTVAGPDRIMTNLPAAERSGLPAFATDWDIRQAIAAALSDDPGLRTVQRSLQIDVSDQRVGLGGYVEDRTQAERVERALRAVPGVLQVDSHLKTDDDLVAAVTDAIKRDPAASAAQIQVVARSGIVDITGEAPDRLTARKIETVARQVSGVQAVHNMVAIRPATAAAS